MERIRDLCVGFAPRDCLLLGGYALYLAFGYMAFESSTLLASGGLDAAFLPSVFLIAVIVVRVAVYACAALVLRKRDAGVAPCVAASCVAGLLGFVVLGMLVQFSGLLPFEGMMPWLMLCGAALGFGGSLLGILWVRFATTFTLRSVYLFALLSNLVSLVVYFLATLAPSFLHVPICAALFGASALCSWRCLAQHPEKASYYEKSSFLHAWRILWRPVLSTSVLAFMAGFMLQVAMLHPIPLNVFQGTSLVTQFVVVLVLLAPALLVKKAFAFESVYKAALPLSAAGFLLLPVIWNGVGGLANACAQLGILVAGTILWCMVADTARSHEIPSTPLFAVCMLCTSTAQLMGTLFGFLRAESLQPGDVALTAVALAALYAVFMVSTFLFKDRSFKGMPGRGETNDCREGGSGCIEGALVASESGAFSDEGVSLVPLSVEALREKREADFEARCARVADEAGFTPREREVFALVARGKTNAAVAEELVVSENTVKFHIKSIYQKLGIHSKAEVVALVKGDNE
ncbi:MAG: helix-turn-helix transcriptional regulator [Slackia sp.]|nr:helix-turn-helix transcriptional regulator [Slackia sp.]